MPDDPPQTLADLGEEALLRRLSARFPSTGDLVTGPGDDCAVVRLGGGADDLLLKTDAVVGGVHFLADEEPDRVGHKALARVLSDIAAMGGRAGHVLVTLALPPDLAAAWVDGFYDGLEKLARAVDCAVAGGELASLPTGQRPVISVAATGRVAAGKAILRSGGKAGDVLVVTGVLGGSLASGHHLDFCPRLAEGQWLAGQGIHALMDLSDGLASDLPRLARASGCNCRVDPASFPCRPGTGVEAAATDGEDYELLAAVSAGAWPALAAAWRDVFPATPLTWIGTLEEGRGGNAGLPGTGGWDHFRRPG